MSLWACCAESLAQTKVRAALRRSSEAAVEQGNQGLHSAASPSEAAKLLQQRQQDLTRIQLYRRGLQALVEQLS